MSRAKCCLNIVALTLIVFTTNVAAQVMYVVDRLAVGIHRDQSLDSAITKVIPTGTRVEIVSRSENVLQVKTEDGIVGWVDKTYLMEEKPAQIALLELETQHVEALNELEVARAKIESLNVQLEAMQSAEAIQASTEAATSDALREMQRLAEENQSLKLELVEAAKLAQVRTQSTSAQPNSSRRASVYSQEFLGLGFWHWILMGALMLLGFGVGGYVVDWSARRRHGGFRV